MTGRYVVLYDNAQGATGAVLCASYERACTARDLLEAEGIETRGVVPVTSIPEAIAEAIR